MAVVVEAPPTVADRSVHVGEGYRPHLDGLRAVAVYLVVLFHAGADRFSGGFIGVDVFFVLSGYLVTQLLMRDLNSRGAIRFPRFYARRMRRLLPASFVALVITAIVYSAIASQTDIGSAVNGFRAAFLYVANWFFIRRSTGYFATDVTTNPVVHFWSLAVEEQFYLLWPLILGALFVLTRRLQHHAHRAMQLAVAVGALASVVWAMHLAGTNLNRAYYGTDTRAYELLAGGLLALSPGIVRRATRYRGAAPVAGLALAVLLLLSTSAIDTNAVRRGIATTIATVVLIVAIESARSGPVNRLLSSAPAVYLGKISYGTYLWHWPVLVVAFTLTNKTISPLSAAAIAALAATGLASLSYNILERPIREQRFLDRISTVVIACGLALGLVSALVIVPGVLNPNRPHTAAGVAATVSHIVLTPLPKNLNFTTAETDLGGQLKGVKFLKNWNCEGRPSDACTVVKGKGKNILVIGDSHAWMMFPAFAKLAQNQNLSFSTAAAGGCPWQLNFYDSVSTDPGRASRCRSYKNDLYNRVLPQMKPDLIVAFENDYLTRIPGFVTDTNNKPIPATSSTQRLSQIKAVTEQSLAELTKYAKQVLIVEPVPVAPSSTDPFDCLTKSHFVEDCRFLATDRSQPLNDMYEHLADNKQVYVENFSKLLCPGLPICDPVINGTIVRWDGQHLTPKYALSLVPSITKYLQYAGLIPPRS